MTTWSLQYHTIQMAAAAACGLLEIEWPQQISRELQEAIAKHIEDELRKAQLLDKTRGES